MKIVANMNLGGDAKERQVSWVGKRIKKVKKYVDNLIVRHYYKGEQLRPEVQKRIEKAMENAEQGKNLSPAFTNTKDMSDWLNSQ